jgi:hypothetical protein
MATNTGQILHRSLWEHEIQGFFSDTTHLVKSKECMNINRMSLLLETYFFSHLIKDMVKKVYCMLQIYVI